MEDKKKINVEFEMENEKDILFLHKQIGEGTYKNKEVRVLLTNTAIIVQVVNEDKKKDQTRDNWILPIAQFSEKLIKTLID